jgi:peroxiredoxin
VDSVLPGRVKLKTFLLGLFSSLALTAQSPIPRPAPELKIVETSGKTTLLSAYRGHVVLLAFISTECGHCQKASVIFDQLSHELAGLQVLEFAFNEKADVAQFAKQFGLRFPIGTGGSDAVHDFLGIARGERLGTPQVVVIDRAGIIRAQSERLGSPILQTADYLREVLKAVGAR